MADIRGLKAFLAVTKRLTALSNKNDDVGVNVGYGMNYALAVHENKEANKKARHAKGQKAKFLEDPTRRLEGTMARNIVSGMKRKGAKLRLLLLKAGMLLQRESQLEVPVDLGALKASAFTALDENLETAAQAAEAKGKAVAAKELAKRAKKRR